MSDCSSTHGNIAHAYGTGVENQGKSSILYTTGSHKVKPCQTTAFVLYTTGIINTTKAFQSYFLHYLQTLVVGSRKRDKAVDPTAYAYLNISVSYYKGKLHR
eukprot:765374-Hanusia_phi.AAC.4